MSNQVSNVSVEVSKLPANHIVVGRFNGAFKGIALRLYNLLIAVPALKADYGKLVLHKVSNDYMSQLLDVVSKADDEVKVRIGKANKDMASSHSFRLVAKDIKTNAGTVAGIVGAIDEMEANGNIKTRFFPPLDVLPDGVIDYLEECKEWADDKTAVNAKGEELDVQ